MNQTSFWKAHFLLLLCLTVGLWSLLFYLVPRGFEMTDNAFYLMAVRNYSDFDATPSMFHTITKTLYDLGGQSVTNFRFLGLIVYLIVGLFSAVTIVDYLIKDQLQKSEVNNWYVYSIGLTIITSSTLQYNNWLNTPNYNWLNHIGLMLFLSGLIIWLSKKKPNHSPYAPFVIMLGFGLSFWAKTPTALLMPLMIIIILILKYRSIASLLTFKHFMGGIFGAILSLSLVFLQGDSLNDIINKLQFGIALQSTKNTGILDIVSYLQTKLLELLGLLYPILTYGSQYLWALLFPITIALCFSFYSASRENFHHYLVKIVHVVIFGGWLFNLIIITQQLNIFQMAVWSLRIFFITLIFTGISIFSEHLLRLKENNNQNISVRPIIGWTFLIFSIPSLFSFGTDSSFALHTGWASYFYLVATLLMLINPLTIKNSFMLHSMPIVLIVLITYFMGISPTQPYRQTDSLYGMNTNIPIQFGDDNLIVSPSMASYITELQEQASLAGFEPQTPIIDLTRNSPGSVFILDGRTDVFPWILGSNEPPHDFIFTLLEQWMLEDLERAWLITNTGSSLEPETEILAHFSLDLSTDYEEVFTITRPYREGSQTFWRPINTP